MTWILALIAILAIGGLVGLSSKSGPETQQTRADQKPNNTAKSEPNSQNKTSASGQEASAQQKHASDNAKEESDKDVEKRADEAREYWPFYIFGARLKITDSLLALFTFLLIVVGGIQGVFLYKTDEGTRQAAEAAKKSADIADRALVVTQRPVVRIVGFPWLWREDTDRPGKYWFDITPTVENVGNTATYDATINMNYELRDTPLPEDFSFPYKGDPSFTLLATKQTVGASDAIILDDDLLLVQQGKKFFYIWGTITYRDGFENTPLRTTEFCAFIRRVFGNPLDPREPGNPKGTTVEIAFGVHPKHQKAT